MTLPGALGKGGNNVSGTYCGHTSATQVQTEEMGEWAWGREGA